MSRSIYRTNLWFGKLEIRLREHRTAVDNEQVYKSCIAVHFIDLNFTIDRDQPKLKNACLPLKYIGSMFIRTTAQPLMNDDDVPIVSLLFQLTQHEIVPSSSDEYGRTMTSKLKKLFDTDRNPFTTSGIFAFNTSRAKRAISLHMRQWRTSIVEHYKQLSKLQAVNSRLHLWTLIAERHILPCQVGFQTRSGRNWRNGKQNHVGESNSKPEKNLWREFQKSSAVVVFTSFVTALPPVTSVWSANAKITKKITISTTFHPRAWRIRAEELVIQ